MLSAGHIHGHSCVMTKLSCYVSSNCRQWWFLLCQPHCITVVTIVTLWVKLAKTVDPLWKSVAKTHDLEPKGWIRVLTSGIKKSTVRLDYFVSQLSYIECAFPIKAGCTLNCFPTWTFLQRFAKLWSSNSFKSNPLAILVLQFYPVMYLRWPIGGHSHFEFHTSKFLQCKSHMS